MDQGAEAIGIDLGGTKLLAGRVDLRGRVLARRQWKTSRADAETVLAQLREAVVALRTERTRAIGVSTLALVDRRSDALGYAGPVPIEGVRLGPLLRQWSGLPVTIENDANAAAFAEAHAGAATGARSAIVIVVGTGIGAGILIDGKLHHGMRGVAGEVGRFPLLLEQPADRRPVVFRRWEELAAGPVLDESARQGSLVAGSDLAAHVAAGGVADGKALVTLAERGAGLARTLLDRHAALLAGGVICCIELLDPEVVVLGGGVFGTGTRLFEQVQEFVRREVLPPANEVRVVRAALGPDAGMIGAGLLAHVAALQAVDPN